MSKKESLQKTRQLRLLLLSCLTGMVLTVCSMLCVAMLMERGVVGAGAYGLYAKLSLAVGMAGAAAYICLRISQDRLLLSILSNVIALLFLLCLSLLCGAGDSDYFEIVTDLAVAVISALLVCAVAAKSTKRRKTRKMHK